VRRWFVDSTLAGMIGAYARFERFDDQGVQQWENNPRVKYRGG
jgi:hypothetical protein